MRAQTKRRDCIGLGFSWAHYFLIHEGRGQREANRRRFIVSGGRAIIFSKIMTFYIEYNIYKGQVHLVSSQGKEAVRVKTETLIFDQIHFFFI